MKKHPKPGDRVKAKKSTKPSFAAGRTGTVIAITDGDLPVSVSFPISFGGTMTLGYEIKELKRA